MFGGCDGNLSDSSNTLSNASATSQAVNIGHGQFFNPNLSVSLSSTSSAGQDPKTQEILCLREENSQLKRRLRDIIGDSDDDDDDGVRWSELSRSRKKQLLGKNIYTDEQTSWRERNRSCKYSSKPDCEVRNILISI